VCTDATHRVTAAASWNVIVAATQLFRGMKFEIISGEAGFFHESFLI
jgi:hypothetical protein